MRGKKQGDFIAVVRSILNDVTVTAFGSVRIPKDKFMMWMSILRKSHLQNESVFLQFGLLGVEFARQHAPFVSDQFFILAAVGLDPARIGAMIDPTQVETKVASMFVQKFQQSASVGLNPLSAPAPKPLARSLPPRSKTGDGQQCDQTMFISHTKVSKNRYHRPPTTQEARMPNGVPMKSEPDFSESGGSTTVVTGPNPEMYADNPIEDTQVGNQPVKEESTRLERTPVIKRRPGQISKTSGE